MYNLPSFNFEEDGQTYAVYLSGKLLALTAFPPDFVKVVPVENKHPNAKLASLDDPNTIEGGKHIINIIREKLENENFF